ncbi:hypothetical protein ZEAMMB73_Zm00001d012778 [Zea mays]|uniref:Uncharacterized protein n=1 Tax=Zea mays TaxID=4577 RepID=A0A1D6GCE3_MAIZE|nr:hypothetical protein ZEAMMB73_Zm00001d012778 [Zea mays]
MTSTYSLTGKRYSLCTSQSNSEPLFCLIPPATYMDLDGFLHIRKAGRAF